MIDMKELLAFAVEQNASDIHIAVGIPPKLRINGRLTEVELPAMTPADAAEAIGSTMHDRHKQILKERGEYIRVIRTVRWHMQFPTRFHLLLVVPSQP